MSEELLDWKDGLSRDGRTRGDYARELRAFMAMASDCSASVFAALNSADPKSSLPLVHEVREKAADLGARRLASAALALEMAIRAGAETEFLYGRFSTAVPDTLVTISAYLSQ